MSHHSCLCQKLRRWSSARGRKEGKRERERERERERVKEERGGHWIGFTSGLWRRGGEDERRRERRREEERDIPVNDVYIL